MSLPLLVFATVTIIQTAINFGTPCMSIDVLNGVTYLILMVPARFRPVYAFRNSCISNQNRPYLQL